jgi:hypothetical protein
MAAMMTRLSANDDLLREIEELREENRLLKQRF